MESKQTGYILIGLGVAFVLMRIVGVSLMSVLWPLWVLVPGLILLYFGYRDGQAQLGWAMPGAVIGGTGAILFVLNLTGRWEAWSYVWALYPVFVGLTLVRVGKHNGDDNMVTGGQVTANSGWWMLVGFGLFFEVLIFGGLNVLNNALLPVLLIIGGLYLLYGDNWLQREKAKRS
jgi:hypothetical protein